MRIHKKFVLFLLCFPLVVSQLKAKEIIQPANPNHITFETGVWVGKQRIVSTPENETTPGQVGTRKLELPMGNWVYTLKFNRSWWKGLYTSASFTKNYSRSPGDTGTVSDDLHGTQVTANRIYTINGTKSDVVEFDLVLGKDWKPINSLTFSTFIGASRKKMDFITNEFKREFEFDNTTYSITVNNAGFKVNEKEDMAYVGLGSSYTYSDWTVSLLGKYSPIGKTQFSYLQNTKSNALPTTEEGSFEKGDHFVGHFGVKTISSSFPSFSYFFHFTQEFFDKEGTLKRTYANNQVQYGQATFKRQIQRYFIGTTYEF